VAATRGSVVDSVEATGTLETVETVDVSTQVSGAIKSLHADFNSRVTQGQVIARLEPSLFETQVEQAAASVMRLQADVERARVEVEATALKLKRAGELWDEQLIPKTDLETADANARQAEASLKAVQAQVAQARASLNQNQVNLSHTIIKAPITGIVISRNVDVGQTVAASTSAPTLFVIAKDLAQMQVNARIDESDIGRIGAGQPVTFKVDAYPQRTFSGTVSQVRLQPIVESNVVSYVTIIDVPNPELKLKPGMTANVTIEIAREDNVLRVPTSALRFRPAAAGGSQEQARSGGSREQDRFSGSKEQDPPYGGERGAQVWVLRDGRIQPVGVTAGLSDGATTAIIGGDLAENTEVVTGVAQAATASQATSPLLPFNGRRGGGAGGNAGRAATARRGGVR